MEVKFASTCCRFNPALLLRAGVASWVKAHVSVCVKDPDGRRWSKPCLQKDGPCSTHRADEELLASSSPGSFQSPRISPAPGWAGFLRSSRPPRTLPPLAFLLRSHRVLDMLCPLYTESSPRAPVMSQGPLLLASSFFCFLLRQHVRNIRQGRSFIFL